MTGWISAPHRLDFTEMTVMRATMIGYQLGKGRSSVSLPSNIMPLEFYFWASQRNTSALVLPRILKSWKTPVSANSVTIFHKYPKRSLQKPKSVCLPEVARRERAKTESFTLNAANGQPIVWMTDDIVNLLCHFIGNRMISHFRKCDAKCKNY